MPKKDLTGQRFGRLTVLYDTGKRNSDRRIIWKCICDCGTECQISSHGLLVTHTKSCGCIRKENAIKKIKQIHGYNIKNLTGQKFGKLTVLQPLKERDQQGRVVWKCLCDCGNFTYVNSTHLLRKKYSTNSCGCLNSKNNMKIKKMLEEKQFYI